LESVNKKDLTEISKNLKNKATAFKKNSKKIKRQSMMDYLKSKIYIVIAVAIVLFLGVKFIIF
jgi:hypothetical protein